MKCYRINMLVISFILGFWAIGLVGCAGTQPTPAATLQVIPDKTFLSPALLKKPIQFKGTGFAPKEMVIVDLLIPEGVKIKSVGKDEKLVGLAFGNADPTGNFGAKMGAMATLNWFFQVGWTPNMKPVFKEATPLRPGKYKIMATGMDSGAKGMATLELVPPPKKKKKS